MAGNTGFIEEDAPVRREECWEVLSYELPAFVQIHEKCSNEIAAVHVWFKKVVCFHVK